MSSVLVQFRTEDTAKTMAASICDRLGLDLQSYLRMCISRMNQENGIPFSMNVNDIPIPKVPFVVTPKEMLDILLGKK